MRKQISKILDQIQAHRSDEGSELEDVATRRKELVRLPPRIGIFVVPEIGVPSYSCGCWERRIFSASRFS